MTENSKTPPAKKTIEDPPEYGAASGDGTSSNWSGRGKPHEAETQENLRGSLNGMSSVAARPEPVINKTGNPP